MRPSNNLSIRDLGINNPSMLVGLGLDAGERSLMVHLPLLLIIINYYFAFAFLPSDWITGLRTCKSLCASLWPARLIQITGHFHPHKQLWRNTRALRLRCIQFPWREFASNSRWNICVVGTDKDGLNKWSFPKKNLLVEEGLLGIRDKVLRREPKMAMTRSDKVARWNFKWGDLDQFSFGSMSTLL